MYLYLFAFALCSDFSIQGCRFRYTWIGGRLAQMVLLKAVFMLHLVI